MGRPCHLAAAAPRLGALDSWLAQDYPALRILVVDDGSTDGSTEILQRRQASGPDRLRVLRNDHLPPGWLGKNHALDLVTRQPKAIAAEWLVFADGGPGRPGAARGVSHSLAGGILRIEDQAPSY